MATGVTMATAGNIFTDAGRVIAATPKKGGFLRFASDTHGPDDTLDPTKFTSTISYTRGRAIYNSLVQHDENLLPQPELAEEFSSNSDATEWTVRMVANPA